MLCKAVFTAAGGKTVEVQYNPSSLQLKAEAGAVSYDHPQIFGMSDCVSQSVERGRMTLSMELLVDSGGKNKVADMVQAFLGLMARESTKEVIFAWEGLIFYGNIRTLSAAYEMFDPDGTPVRGKIRISLEQCGSREQAYRYWDEAYSRMFSTGR